MGAVFSAMKLSLHGPDDRHPVGPMLKCEVTLPDRTDTTGKLGVLSLDGSTKPRFRVSGRQVAPGVRLAVRIRTTWDLFGRRVPPVDTIKMRGADQVALVVPAPRSLYAADVDLFVCDGRPFWPNEAQARRNNAALPTIQNTVNPPQYLTGVSYQRFVATNPEPRPMPIIRPTSTTDQLRGFLVTGANSEFLWVTEYLVSRSAFLSDLYQGETDDSEAGSALDR